MESWPFSVHRYPILFKEIKYMKKINKLINIAVISTLIIKKCFIYKIVLLVISIVFLYNIMLYAHPIPKDTLRLQSSMQDPECKARIYTELIEKKLEQYITEYRKGTRLLDPTQDFKEMGLNPKETIPFFLKVANDEKNDYISRWNRKSAWDILAKIDPANPELVSSLARILKDNFNYSVENTINSSSAAEQKRDERLYARELLNKISTVNSSVIPALIKLSKDGNEYDAIEVLIDISEHENFNNISEPIRGILADLFIRNFESNNIIYAGRYAKVLGNIGIVSPKIVAAFTKVLKDETISNSIRKTYIEALEKLNALTDELREKAMEADLKFDADLIVKIFVQESKRYPPALFGIYFNGRMPEYCCKPAKIAETWLEDPYTGDIYHIGHKFDSMLHPPSHIVEKLVFVNNEIKDEFMFRGTYYAGHIRIDLPINIDSFIKVKLGKDNINNISEQEKESLLIEEIIKIATFLNYRLENAELTLLDSTKLLFSEHGIIIPEKITIGSFLESVKGMNTKAVRQPVLKSEKISSAMVEVIPTEEIHREAHVRHSIIIDNELGLHVATAYIIADKIMKNSKSQAILKKGFKKASAENMMELLVLAAEKGDKVEIEVKGEDAQFIAKEIEKALINENSFLNKEPTLPSEKIIGIQKCRTDL